MPRSGKVWYLCYFLHRLLDYRLPEIEALAKLHGYCDGEKVGQGLQWKQAPDHHPDSPFYYVPFKCQVQLKKPQHKFWLIDIDDQAQQNGLPPLPAKRMYFGREIGSPDRSVITKYELSRRKYLGPTAMDAELLF